eukprot:767862-Hanusia_phi.AAC.2
MEASDKAEGWGSQFSRMRIEGVGFRGSRCTGTGPVEGFSNPGRGEYPYLHFFLFKGGNYRVLEVCTRGAQIPWSSMSAVHKSTKGQTRGYQHDGG